MPEVIKILYATDLSTNSAYAFQFASEYAEKNNSELVILHVQKELPQYVIPLPKGESALGVRDI